MCEQNMLLVKTIEKYPCLYNHNYSDYSKRDITEKAWNEVAKEIKLHVSECKEKWKKLRYSFLRSLKPSLDGSSKKKYYLNDEMQFILPYVRVLTSKANENVSHYEDFDTDVENDDNLNKKSPVQYSEINDSLHINEPATKKVKSCESFASYYQQPPTTYQQPTYDIPEKLDVDSRRMFLLSLMPEVVELTGQQMRKFRRRVLELLDEISENRNDDNVFAWTQENHNQDDIEKKETI